MGRWKTNTHGENVPWWRAEGPHSAVRTSTPVENGSYSSARAGTRADAREGSDPTAHPQVHSAAAPMPTHSDETGGDTGVGEVEVISPIAETPRGWRVPAAPAWTRGMAAPDWWATQPPSLSTIWAFASRGEWTAPTGLPRFAGRAYAACVAIPVISVLNSAVWITVWGGSRLWHAGEIEPGDLVSDDMPALAAIWQAVTTTAQTAQPATQPTKPGGLSHAGVAYAVAALPFIAVCYAAGWTVERFSRLAVAAILPGLALGLIPLPWT